MSQRHQFVFVHHCFAGHDSCLVVMIIPMSNHTFPCQSRHTAEIAIRLHVSLCQLITDGCIRNAYQSEIAVLDVMKKVLAVPCQRLCREYLLKLSGTAAHTSSAALPPQHVQRCCRAAFLYRGRPAPKASRAPHASRPRDPPDARRQPTTHRTRTTQTNNHDKIKNNNTKQKRTKNKETRKTKNTHQK